VKRNVKRWRSGQMMLRWVAAGVLEAVKDFRRVKGYADMPMLVAALRARDRQLGLSVAQEERQIAWSSTEPPLNFNSRRDIPGTTFHSGASAKGWTPVRATPARRYDELRGWTWPYAAE
jgi:hypothetical protein